jgi:hypothetical protein
VVLTSYKGFLNSFVKIIDEITGSSVIRNLAINWPWWKKGDITNFVIQVVTVVTDWPDQPFMQTPKQECLVWEACVDQRFKIQIPG